MPPRIANVNDRFARNLGARQLEYWSDHLLRSLDKNMISRAETHSAHALPACRTPGQWYNSLPPVTRFLLTTYLITGVGLLVGVTPLRQMYLDWGLVFRYKKLPEVWRLIANFAFIGKPSMGYLFNLIWLVQYGGALEAGDFAHNAADGIFMMLVGMTATLAFDFLTPFGFFRSPFHGTTLIFMLLYLWSKRNPNAPVSIFGLIRLQGLYLPFAFMAVTLLMGGDWTGDLLGILAGHVYYFLRDVYPRSSGRNVLQTPLWLTRLVHRWGLGRVPIQAVNPAHASDAGFRAFQGRGRRLAD